MPPKVDSEVICPGFFASPPFGRGVLDHTQVRPNQRDPSWTRPLKRKTPRLSLGAIGGLVFLLAFPFLAGLRLAQWIDYRLISGVFLVISVWTYLAYRGDKKKAEAGEWRTPESTLHFLELLGGWPAAFLSQRLLRHKISKLKYQLVFWAIVAIHQFAAFDFLKGWQNTKKLLTLVNS